MKNKCYVCEHEFGSKRGLDTHIGVKHSEERLILCEYCDRKFKKRPPSEGDSRFCSLRCYHKSLKGKIPSYVNVWSKEEIEYLVNNYARISKEILSKHLNRSPNAIKSKASQLGVRKDKEFVSRIISKRYSKNKVHKTCQCCGKSFDVVPSHSNRKFCSVECSREGQQLPSNRWTREEEDFIRTNYEHMTANQIAKKLGRTKAAIQLHVYYEMLGLSKYGKSQAVECAECEKVLHLPPSLIGESWGNFCSLECKSEWQSKNFRGEQHPLWKGGISFNYGIEWGLKRNLVRKRDNFRCQACGIKEKKRGQQLDIHHIIPYRTSQDNSLDNLISLCPSCHRKMEVR